MIEQRCVVCHGCYDAPCQLKLDAWAGLRRGGSKDKVYDGTRLRAANLTRLYEDAHDIEGWRERGFHPVLDEKQASDGTLLRMLALKEKHPSPTSGPLPDSFDFRLDRDQACPRPDEMDAYEREQPLQGMPYGLPGLDAERRDILVNWVESGAPGAAPAMRRAEERRAVAEWEAFLNGESNRQRLMARYIYEHLFIGSLYLSDLQGSSAWYTLVRSRTPPGEPIDIIATRRPYDDPGIEPFYYRLQARHLSRLAKRHMPYALSAARMERWRKLFLAPDYTVDTLPGYEGKSSANPFVTFEALPVNARYRFMLEEAQFTIMAYIKGPVCRGQVALNVIDDHFWVAFAKPDYVDPEKLARFLAAESYDMRLPQPKGSLIVTALQWNGYAKSQRRFLKAKAEATARGIGNDRLSLDLDLIWDGDGGSNDNAALTVFRHFDSATVVKGFVGQKPKTMWIIDYSLLERIHYLLVAGFDVYGGIAHQLESRLYMDFLRMEGENAFLLFLPEEERMAVRDYWYRNARERVRGFVLAPKNEEYERPSAIDYETDDPRSELMDKLAAHIPTAASPRYSVADTSLTQLMRSIGAHFSHMPEASFLQVLPRRGDPRYYTLVHNRAFSNNAQLFNEESRRLPEEDTLTVVRGFVSSYPNMFFQVTEAQLDRFTSLLLALDSDDAYSRIVERYGVRRTAPWFWKLSDDMHAAYFQNAPVEAGVFDLNRYQNR
ncbi:MAG: fatty acid cis/trans isomerase [Halieaceae bacterium]|nr:fatty acid cis/trans isomerase [Halieaceae bacterium]